MPDDGGLAAQFEKFRSGQMSPEEASSYRETLRQNPDLLDDATRQIVDQEHLLDEPAAAPSAPPPVPLDYGDPLDRSLMAAEGTPFQIPWRPVLITGLVVGLVATAAVVTYQVQGSKTPPREEPKIAATIPAPAAAAPVPAAAAPQPQGFELGLSGQWFHNGPGSSNLFGCAVTTPPVPGASYTDTITRPDNSKVTQTGVLDPAGKATISVPITQYGIFTQDLTVTASSIMKQKTVTTTVTAAQGVQNGCP